jgi:hypothetical protein
MLLEVRETCCRKQILHITQSFTVSNLLISWYVLIDFSYIEHLSQAVIVFALLVYRLMRATEKYADPTKRVGGPGLCPLSCSNSQLLIILNEVFM